MDKFNLIYGDSEKKTLEANLLPCPFCGEKAELSGMFPQGQYYITCTGCRVSLWQDRKDKAINNWNSRIKNNMEKTETNNLTKVYSFLYCGCIHESSYATMSLHRTKKGAIAAMKKHKEEAKKKHLEYVKSMTEKINADPEDSEKSKKILIKSLGKFGQHKDWGIGEEIILD